MPFELSTKRIYKGQDWRLTIGVEGDTAGATDVKIHYTKPNKQKGFWIPTSPQAGVFQYDISAAENNIAGLWKFQLEYQLGGKVFVTDDGAHEILDRI